MIEERVEGCRVKLDSKKQKTESSIENCLEATYNGTERLGSRETFLPFYVVVYPFIGINQFNSHFRKVLYKLKYFVKLPFFYIKFHTYKTFS